MTEYTCSIQRRHQIAHQLSDVKPMPDDKQARLVWFVTSTNVQQLAGSWLSSDFVGHQEYMTHLMHNTDTNILRVTDLIDHLNEIASKITQLENQ